jgi:hypothetical protein
MCTSQVRTHFARPNWREVFTKIAAKHPSATVGMIFTQAVYSFTSVDVSNIPETK